MPDRTFGLSGFSKLRSDCLYYSRCYEPRCWSATRTQLDRIRILPVPAPVAGPHRHPDERICDVTDFSLFPQSGDSRRARSIIPNPFHRRNCRP